MKKKVLIIFLFLIVHCTFESENCSSQWVTQSSGTNNPLYCLSFTDNFTGYIVGGAGIILKTTNSGTNWIKLPGWNSNTNLFGVRFLNPLTGWIVGSYGTIIMTTTGGTSWINQCIDTTIQLNKVFFIDSTTGWIVGGNSTILKTTNSGINWVKQPVIPTASIYDIRFIDLNLGWLACGGCVYKTTNGGINWIKKNPPLRTWRSIFFVNPDTGWIVGSTYSMCRSTDGGETWINGNLLCFPFSDDPSPPATYTSVQFINQNTGWYTIYHALGGVINKTTDGGNSWIASAHLGVGKGLEYIRVNSSGIGWTVGFSGTILYTNNAGSSDYYYISGNVNYMDNNQPVTNGVIKAIKYNSLNGNIIFLDSAQIQLDGSYLLSHITQDSLYIGLYPNSGSTPDYVISYYPATTNWQQATVLYPTGNLTNINLQAIRLQNSDMGNSVSGKVMKNISSTAGSLENAVLYARKDSTYYGCSVTNANGVYHLQELIDGNVEIIVNRFGYMGDSISINLTPTTNTDSINFYLYRYPRILTGINQSGAIPKEYKLYQNYPNPFNPATKIKFDVKEDGRGNMEDVKLVIYDITGREIETLLNETLQPGTYEVTFDGSNLSSGIYFYKLSTENYAAMKKMLLIK